jgi:hypothetical protein
MVPGGRGKKDALATQFLWLLCSKCAQKNNFLVPDNKGIIKQWHTTSAIPKGEASWGYITQ